jgi:ketosteroid isomerase-like protein
MDDELLARLAAESEIRQLVGRYCDAVNRRDAEAAGALFAADAEIAIADFPPITGAEAIREGMRETFAAHEFLHQQCAFGPLAVAGTLARARLSVFEAAKRRGEDSVSLIFGFYADEYRHDPGGWRFARLRNCST